MEGLISEAAGKGMYLVDHENTDPLFEEFEEVVADADALCEVVDPENKPFEAKYKARTMLDQIINKLDATRAIAKVEMKNDKVEQLDRRIACGRVKVGTISWECEEPHNAQTDLDLACQFYFPGFVDEVIELTKDDDHVDEAEALVAKKTVAPTEIKTPPTLPVLRESMVVDAMRALNMLGVLWAGRGQIHKSMLYLLAARQFYLTSVETAEKQAPLGQKSKFGKKTLGDLGSAFTHNLFYLAQAYGNLGDTRTSCNYCHQTLQRQFSEGFRDIRPSLDWVKNCCGISDFYFVMRQYNNCALSLASAEWVLKKVTIPRILAANATDNAAIRKLDSGNNNYVSGSLNAAEIEADLNRRWALLDVSVMKGAFERAKSLRNALAMGLSLTDVEAELQEEQGPPNPDDFDMTTARVESGPGSVFQQAEATAAQTENSTPNAGAGPDDKAGSNTASTAAPSARITYAEVEFFKGIPVRPTSHLAVADIQSFDDARLVYLRAVARIDAAKKYYVLDGHVTDHVTLMQEHSKLYHYLSAFEADPKRQLAMEQRRFDMLAPLLKALSKSSFEVLHKQISYELGEGALTMLDMKLDKFRQASSSGEIEVRTLKKAEIAKCNDYCRQGLAMFAHFTYMYAANKDRDATHSVQYLEERPLHALVACGCTTPDETFITAEEVRPFLNAHFLSCRIMSKVIATTPFLPPVDSSDKSQRAHYLVHCLRRYQWLAKFAPAICAKRELNLAETFGEEHKICEEMVRLLPSKIDRMCFLGESGLSL